MAHLLIWGETREILAGELPAGPPAEEVRSLAALEAALDGRGRGARARRPRAASRPSATRSRPGCAGAARRRSCWWRWRTRPRATTCCAASPSWTTCSLRPVTPARLRRKLERAIESLGTAPGDPAARAGLARKGEELSELNKIGVALSAERDIDKLLELILSKSREITGADAGSLYLVERAQETRQRQRRPAALQARPERHACPSPFEEFTMPLDETSIAGYVALTGRDGERSTTPTTCPRARPSASAAPSTRSRATARSRCWSCPCATTRTW